MKEQKVIIDEKSEVVRFLSTIHENTPIFAKKNGVLKGMVVNENGNWILRIGGSSGCSGHYKTRIKCIEESISFGYEFCTFKED